MSLDTVPKTNWTTDDGARTTDMDEIGANLQALEDSKYQEDDNIVVDTITSGDITANDIIANDITVNDITADDITLTGFINPINVTSGSQVIGAGSTWTPSIGFYVVSGSLTLVIEVNGHSTGGGGGFFTDGSAIKVRNNGGGSATAFFIKMG